MHAEFVQCHTVGTAYSGASSHSLLRVDADGWMAELPLIEDYYASFGEHVPQELKEELEELKRKLEAVTVNVA